MYILDHDLDNQTNVSIKFRTFLREFLIAVPIEIPRKMTESICQALEGVVVGCLSPLVAHLIFCSASFGAQASIPWERVYRSLLLPEASPSW